MDRKTTRHLDRLLADGEISGPEADEILDRVLETVAREERPRRARSWLPSGILAAAAAAGGVVWYVSLPERVPGEFVPRGEATPATLVLQADCPAGVLTACPSSSTLVFSIAGDEAGGFLSAYAEPAGGGERIWYFSRESGSPELAEGGGTRVFTRGVKLAGSHHPGRYVVNAFVANQPLTKAELLAGPEPDAVRARARIELTVSE